MNVESIKTEPFTETDSGFILPAMETVYPRNDMLAMRENYHNVRNHQIPIDVSTTSRQDVVDVDSGGTSGLVGYSYGGLPATYSGYKALRTNRLTDSLPQVKLKKARTAPPGMGKRSHLPKRYKCSMCAYRTRYKSDLNRHVRKHAVAAYNCDVCNMPFKTVGNVEFHRRKEHPDKAPLDITSELSYKCHKCPYETLNEERFQDHIETHALNEITFVAGKKDVQSQEEADNHVTNGDDCGVSKSSHHGTDNHSHTESTFTEDMCTNGEQIVLVEDDDDCIEHTDGDALECGEIEYVNDVEPEEEYTPEDHNDRVTTENTANESEQISPAGPSRQTESADDKHHCDLCGMKFNRKILLDIHLKKFHCKALEKEADFYTDKNYELAFDQTTQETAVKKTKADTTPYKRQHQCPFCPYSTPYKSTHDRHVRKHETGCYSCPACRMPFVVMGNLKRHIRENHPGCQSDQVLFTFDGGEASRRCREDVDWQQQTTTDNRPHSSEGQFHRPDGTSSPRVSAHPPQSGRYARLVSDFDEFAQKPFACSLCFFRTNSTKTLYNHVENHVTGCNLDPIPESARMTLMRDDCGENQTTFLPPSLPVLRTVQPGNVRSEVNIAPTNSGMLNMVDKAHIKQEVRETTPLGAATKKAKSKIPLWCLPCKKRFKTPQAAKQHFRQRHGQM